MDGYLTGVDAYRAMASADDRAKALGAAQTAGIAVNRHIADLYAAEAAHRTRAVFPTAARITFAVSEEVGFGTTADLYTVRNAAGRLLWIWDGAMIDDDDPGWADEATERDWEDTSDVEDYLVGAVNWVETYFGSYGGIHKLTFAD
jgi:hypothetical protein